MPAPMKYDWPVAEAAFVYAPDGEPYVTLKTISMQFGIPYQTVRRYAAKRNWTEKRINYICPLRIKEQLRKTNNPYVAEALRERLKCYKSRQKHTFG
ncbi:hypothetical protein [Aneurinibacillus danicus]|uniref:Uncharacterized protein n=1 Tax=Aneurinibacillus danicus TaxID=267746 RepID=A0A511VAH1_9BACL|nr:hypothetical protein [Aneurinibacillus danicus]GEN35917.1 hypothetical protein ADA01nite_33770 [Aneurinibacillus danicus]